MRVLGLATDTHHSVVNFMVSQQMIQRSTNYPIKMAALVICQVSVLAMIVWIFHYIGMTFLRIVIPLYLFL